ncbi:sensor histidine kinase [Pseudactinotalea sp. Z1732]|uniref:sensor histidine kinase n=1 Tax=Pseudactinotalea sp. Z1732 TaxID=3413026 RepID=UPI003C79C819
MRASPEAVSGGPARAGSRGWPHRWLGGWTWLYLLITVGSCVSAIIEPDAHTWQRVLIALAVPAVVWGVLVRHHRPLVLPVVALVLVATSTDAVLPVAMFSLVLRRRDRLTALVAALAAGLVVISFQVQAFPSTMGAGLTFEGEPVPALLEPWLELAAELALLIGLPMLLGAFLAQRRALVATLRERARRAEEEQELRAARAVAAERERISGEMHDVVGHKLALISMQAGALEVNPDAEREVVEAQAKSLRQTAGEAQAELRGLLDMMVDDDAPLAPQAGLEEVPALVERTRSAGVQVELALAVDEEVGPAVGRAIYRIVQEGLTNALRHGCGGSVEVSVRGGGREAVVVEVSNPLQGSAGRRDSAGRGEAARAGMGLASLAERVRVLGGTLEAGPMGERWVLRAELPAQGVGSSGASDEVRDGLGEERR